MYKETLPVSEPDLTVVQAHQIQLWDTPKKHPVESWQAFSVL